MSSIAKQVVRKLHFMVHIDACIPQYAKLIFSLTLQALPSKLFTVIFINILKSLPHEKTAKIFVINQELYMYVMTEKRQNLIILFS